jgi:hypothetical protein
MESEARMSKLIGRFVRWAMPGLWAALLAAGCTGVNENERAIIESTPDSEPAPYAVSREAYRNHMLERFKGMNTKDYGKQVPKKTKKARKKSRVGPG